MTSDNLLTICKTITDKMLNTWAQQWEALGEITESHLQKQYDESIALFDRYRKKKDEYGYDVLEDFNPNETHVEGLFELKVPMLYGYAYQLIKKKFEGKEKTKRLAALKRLIYKADKFNLGNPPQFSLLIFKSLNILVSYLMSQSDSKGDISRYIIEDPILYQYFKNISLETISLEEHVMLVKKRAHELIIINVGKEALTSLPTPKIKHLTLWYYFIPYMAFEIFLYYPKTIFPIEFFWRAHHHEVGVAAIGDGNCSVHGSTINNTFNMFLHDLFHWRRWVNKFKLDKKFYRNINIQLQSYLLSCITNPATGLVDNFQDLAVFFFLIHEGFYTELELSDRFVGNFLSKDVLTKLFFGISHSNESISSVVIPSVENFKRFIGHARKVNAIIELEYTIKPIWLLKKLKWLLNEEIHQNSTSNVSNITLAEVSGIDSERNEITGNFKYIVEKPNKITPFLHGKFIISAIDGDHYNLKIMIKPTNGNTNFKEMERIILSYCYARKNSADDYDKFLGFIYPDIFDQLPDDVEADPGFISMGVDRLFVDFYERHKNKFAPDANPV